MNAKSEKFTPTVRFKQDIHSFKSGPYLPLTGLTSVSIIHRQIRERVAAKVDP